MHPIDDQDRDPEVVWDEELEARLDALDREGPDPRPWRVVVNGLRQQLANRDTRGESDDR